MQFVQAICSSNLFKLFFTDYLERGDEEKDEMQGALGISTPEQPYGCEDLKSPCNEAARFFFAPLLVKRGRIDTLVRKFLELIHNSLPVSLVGYTEPA